MYVKTENGKATCHLHILMYNVCHVIDKVVASLSLPLSILDGIELCNMLGGHLSEVHLHVIETYFYHQTSAL